MTSGEKVPPAGPGPDRGRAAPAATLGAGLLSSAAIVFVGNIVARGLGFLFPLVLTRVVGKSDFALVYFFINTGFSVGELVLTGFPTAMTRYVAADPLGRARWVSSALLGGAPLLAISIACGFALAIQTDAPPALMAVVVVGLTIDAYYFALLQGLGWFGTLMLYRVAANVGQLVVLAVAALLGVASVGLAVAAYSLLYLAPIAVIEWKRGPLRLVLRDRVRPTKAALRTLTRFSIPALISGVCYAAIQGFDVYFVRVFAPGQLADYGAARSLAMPMQLVPFAIAVILLPRVASAKSADRVRMLRMGFGLTLAALVAASLCYLVLARPLIDVLFPASYQRATGLLVLLAPALGLVGLYSVLSQWWMGTGHSLVPASCIFCGAVLAAVAQTVLTPRMGASGAAVSIALGALLALCLLGALTLAEVTGRLSLSGGAAGDTTMVPSRKVVRSSLGDMPPE
jgi:O-antigen/teichoic acid export membrane protein